VGHAYAGPQRSKKPHHYEWEIGWSSARENHPHLFFALVNLKRFQELPDVFIIPSKVIFKYFKGGDSKTWVRARYHPSVGKAGKYKNKFGILEKTLT